MRQRSLPAPEPAAWMILLGLLAAVFLAVTLLLAQPPARPAPDPPDRPPPIQFGPSAGQAKPM
jgi:hypothetical protein